MHSETPYKEKIKQLRDGTYRNNAWTFQEGNFEREK